MDLLHELATPALVLDGPLVQRNVRRLAEYSNRVGIKIRPHTKTHKLRPLAVMQLEAGANGLTAAKVSEAEVISQAGEDLLLAYPPVGPSTPVILTLRQPRQFRIAVGDASSYTRTASPGR